MTIPKITEQRVKSLFDSGSFQRGKSYYRAGNIQHPKCQGITLRAQCLGSSYAPYRVQVELKSSSKVTTSCSCPIGGGCKHCIALLLQWIHTPDSFNSVEELTHNLAERSKEELIKLIGQMIDKHPDLETLVEISLLNNANAALDPEVIREQVLAVIEEEGGDDYDYYGRVDLSGLKAFEDLIKGYFAAEEWFNAATISMTMIETLLNSYDQLHDDNGEVNYYVDSEVDHLGAALEHLQDPEEREAVLQALFDVYAWDVDYGGIDMGYRSTEIILDAAAPQEEELLRQWIRKKLANVPDEKYGSDFRRSAYGGFLLQLEEDSLDDEAYIRICRESGRTSDLVDRLLRLNRADEALREVRPIEDYSLLRLADQFVQHDAEDLIRPLIQVRAANEERRNTYSNWLKERALANGDTATVLSILSGMFARVPELGTFQELSAVAQERGEWEPLRSQIMAQLQKDEKYSLLTQIHLDEKNIDDALRTVELVKRLTVGFGLYNHTKNLKLQVAAAAEESHPNASIRFYLEIAENLINARGRGNYQAATEYLQKARRLYQKLGQNDEWLRLIRHIREQNRALRAMKDEFNRAGLEE